jgi:hypothetical protein
MIELTVGLPMFNCKYIGWLSLESLCRQQNIKFEWELVIAEEILPNYNPLGKEEIVKFKDRLYQVGCRRIEYIGLKKWIPLSKKWKLLAAHSSSTSKVFIIQAADCFSYSTRLNESFDLIVNKHFDFVSSQIGPFYDIKTEKAMMYDTRKRNIVAGLNMAINPYYMRNLPDVDKRISVDAWIIKCMTALNPGYRSVHNDSKNCILGVDTHGLNNISMRRRKLMNIKKSIWPITIKIELYIPPDILKRLKECKPYSR